MKELDLTDEQLNVAMKAAYDENPNVGFFDTGFKKGFLFAKKIAISATNYHIEKKDILKDFVNWYNLNRPNYEIPEHDDIIEFLQTHE